MMQEYSVGGLAAAPSTSPEAQGVLWNPSAAIILFVTYIAVLKIGGAGPSLGIARFSTRGTPGSTVTPDADNAYSRQAAPPSGAELNLSDFTVVPTLAGPEVARFRNGEVAGSGLDVYTGRIEVPPGTGLGVYHIAGTPQAHHVAFTWRE